MYTHAVSLIRFIWLEISVQPSLMPLVSCATFMFFAIMIFMFQHCAIYIFSTINCNDLREQGDDGVRER